MIAKAAIIAGEVVLAAGAFLLAFSDAVDAALIAAGGTFFNTILLLLLGRAVRRIPGSGDSPYMPLRDPRGRLIGYVDRAVEDPPASRRADDEPPEELPSR